ncbi:MAG: bis(5'-nucleosyl)-tetraphosphatase (symmetrical) YqeK [Clostridia bacterium]|nr:bis(5'-nucleosyl)-tetraphosphatase (symmetrical) YqeK [Clostridia bacterium]
MIEITEQMLTELRKQITNRMSPKRLHHTLAVEDMTARLCALYCPEKATVLRAAALLHDLTKELSLEEQIQLCKEKGLSLCEQDLHSPKTLHARTAAAVIPSAFPNFADPLVIRAVRWHTVGRAGMTLPEKLLYLADYIDDSRTFENCVRLRHAFWSADPETLSPEQRLFHLHRILLLSFQMTITDLLAEGALISPETIAARNELLLLPDREARS